MPLDAEVETGARELAALGFSAPEARHLAFAGRAGTRWFVTDDDTLVRRAGWLGDSARWRCSPPAPAWKGAG